MVLGSQGRWRGCPRSSVDGFNCVDLEEIVSFTVPAKVRSTRVMEWLGLTHDPADDFDHPRLTSAIAFVATTSIGSNALIVRPQTRAAR